MYLVFNDVDAYLSALMEINTWFFALTDKNKKALENYRELWDEIKEEIRTIKGTEPFKYEKDFMKIRFKSDYGSPLGKILNIPVSVIITKSVFEENDKYDTQGHLKGCFLSMSTKTKMILMLLVAKGLLIHNSPVV